MVQKKLSKKKVEVVKSLLQMGKSYREIKKQTKVSLGSISNIVKTMQNQQIQPIPPSQLTVPYIPPPQSSIEYMPPRPDVGICSLGEWPSKIFEEPVYRQFPIWRNGVETPSRRVIQEPKIEPKKPNPEILYLREKFAHFIKELRIDDKQRIESLEYKIKQRNLEIKENEELWNKIYHDYYKRRTERKDTIKPIKESVISDETWQSFLNTRQKFYDHLHEKQNSEFLMDLIGEFVSFFGNVVTQIPHIKKSKKKKIYTAKVIKWKSES